MFFKKRNFDLIVIGSGAGGNVGAEYAASIGKKVAIFESEAIGGECPNFACVPTKSLLYTAEIYETINFAKNFGIEVEKVNLNYPQVKKWKDLVVSRTGAQHGEKLLEKANIEVIKEKATFISPHEILAGDKKYSAHKFLIATGSKTFIPPIPNLEETGYITFRQAIDYEKPPSSLFILGGGPIGCEFAQIFSTFGVKVTIADTLDRLLAKDDKEVSKITEALFKNRGINVLTKIIVTSIDKKGSKKVIHYKKDGLTHKEEVEEILIATGKKPNLDFDPQNAGIEVKDGHLKINQYLQTTKSHIFAAGDVIGPYLFTHTGYYQSYLAISNAFSYKKIKPDYSIVPRCVFIKPEIASVGLSELQAKEQGIKIKKGITPIAIIGRANTSNEFDGFVKVITNLKEEIIGASIVAPRAGEMIHELALAMKLKAKAKDLADLIHAYPTYSESIKIACSSLENA